MHASRIVVFQNLSVWNVAFALFARLFAHVYFMHPHGTLRTAKHLTLLDALGVKMLRYAEGGSELLLDTGFVGGPTITKMFWNLFPDGKWLATLSASFPNVADAERKLTICTQRTLHSMTSGIEPLAYWCRHFAGQGATVYVVTCNVFWQNVCKALDLRCRNLCPALPVLAVRGLLRGTGAVFRLLRAKMRRACPSGITTGSSSVLAEETFEVLLFPHQGITYGNLFRKEHFYSEDEKSPYHPSKILHVEYAHLLGTERQQILDTYKNEGMALCVLRRNITADSAKALLRFFHTALRNLPTSAVSLGDRCKALTVLLAVYALYRTSLNGLRRFRNAKVALIGYDWVFPPTTSLALETLGVETVAVQERFGEVAYPQFYFIADHYMVTSDYYAGIAQRAGNIAVNHLYPVGEYRTDVLFNFLQNPPKRRDEILSAGYTKIVLALDFHSNADPCADNASLYNSQVFNKHFYHSVLALAQEHPDWYFIIRGKNCDWLELPFFEDVVAFINRQHNVEVSTEYSRYNVSYELASMADAVIGRFTSMLDECLFAHIPSLMLDYYPGGHKGFFRNIDDRNGVALFTHSPEELHDRLLAIFRNEGVYSTPDGRRLIREVYGDFFDGKCTMRIQETIHTIFNNCSNR